MRARRYVVIAVMLAAAAAIDASVTHGGALGGFGEPPAAQGITGHGGPDVTADLGHPYAAHGVGGLLRTAQAQSPPEVSEESVAVTGNGTSTNSTMPVQPADTTKPSLAGAAYHTDGTLTLSFSEALDQTGHDAGLIHVRDAGQTAGGVTLSNDMVTSHAGDSITFGLGDDHAAAVNLMSAPQLDMDAGAVRDEAGNPSDALADYSISVTGESTPNVGQANAGQNATQNTGQNSTQTGQANAGQNATQNTGQNSTQTGQANAGQNATQNTGQNSTQTGQANAGQNATQIPTNMTGASAEPESSAWSIRADYTPGDDYTDGNVRVSIELPNYDDCGEPNVTASKLSLKASKGSTVTVGSDKITTSWNEFEINVTSKENTLRLQTPPRTVEVQTGGITCPQKSASNTAKLTAALSNSNDNEAPTIDSAVYGVSGNNKYVTVTFNEDVISVIKAKMYLVNSTDAEMSLASNTVTHSSHTNRSKITLTSAQVSWFDLSDPPYVRITANGTTDVWGNMNSENVTSDNPIKIPDALSAAIDSASYSPWDKTVSVSTSINLNAVDHTKIKVKAGSSTVSFANATDPDGSSSFTLGLTNAQNTKLEKQTPPRQIEIGVGGITDDTGTKNPAKITSVLSNQDDQSHPQIQSAVYGVSGSTSFVTVTFDEDTIPVDHAKVYIVNSTGTEISFASNKISHTTHTNSSKITLTAAQKNWFDLSNPPDVRITPNGITDVWGNTNSDQNVTSIITVPNALRAAINSATYNPTEKTISVSTSLTLNAVDSSKIKLKAKSGSTISVTNVSSPSGSDFTIRLTDAQNKNLAKQTPPRTVEIGIGGITDDTNTKNVAAMTGVLSNSDDSTYPSINSATYGISGSTASVTVTFDEDTLPVDHAKVYIVNSTGGEISFASNKISHTTHTNSSKITLTTAQKNWFDLSDPPEVRITPNGITDVWGNTNSDQNVTQTITVPDALVTTISSAQYSPSSKDLTVDLSHQVHQIDGSKIKLKAKSGSTISVSSSQLDTTQDTSYFTINLTSHASTFEAQTPPRTIEIQKNGITDDYGAKNVDAITTTISYSDSSAPSISAANYTGGTIKATFDEKVLSLNKSKVSITAKSGAAILVSGQTSHTARSDHLTITLTNAQKASYAAQTPPRSLTIQQNGMSDIWGNQNDNSVSQTITYLDDTAPPSINSATYDVTSRTLNVTLSEKVVALDHNSISITASKGNPVTPTSSQLNHATHTDNFTVTLDAAGGDKVISQTHPRQVSIAASKLTDIWGNGNSAALSYAISYTGDTSAPSISSATYNTAAGTMAVTISEASLPVVQSKVRLTDSSANMSVSTISHTSHATSFTITLSNAEKASFRAQTPPRQVQVLAGGLTDVWNNANQNALTRTASYTGDTTAPGILSATYNTDTRDLLVILNEDIVSAKHDKMKLKGSGSGEITDIQSNQITLASHSDRFTIRLTTQQNTTFTGLAEPRTIVIDAGGVADVWSNANSAQLTSPSIRNDNNDPLAVNEAEYGVDTGVLNVTMSKSLKSYDSAKIKVGDASSNMTFQAGAFTRVSSDEITTTLAGNAKTTFENLNHPRKVFVLAGGATDLWDVNNPNDIEAAISYDDETAPSLSSASYATASGRLTVALSEHLASHDSAKLVLYDSTKAGNVTLTSNAMTQNPSGTISTTLSGATKGAFENMTHPRHIAILAGGVTDRWNNHNAAELTAAISDDDNTAPALSSASYSKSTGDITIKLSERAASYNAAKFALHDSSKTGNVTLTSNTMTQNPFGTLTARLSDTQRESFADLNYPRHLAISSGGVTDIWNNANAAQLSTAVSYSDPNNMTITSAEYDVNSGLLNVTVSEDIFRHDSAKIILKDSSSSVTFGSGDFAESKPGFLTITLDSAKKASFEGLSHPRNVTIQAGGVADIWNRTNDKALTRHIQYEGTVAPSISSAEYGSATGLLNATFPESLARYDHSRIILNDSSANVTIASGSLSQHTSGVLTVKLSGSVLGQFENLTHPRSITVLAGGVSDIWNRTNEAALARSVSYDDAAAPALNSVSYSTVRGEMTITLSERAASHDSTKFVLYDSTKTGNVTLSGTLAQNTHGTLTATLTTAQKTSLASLSNPRHLAILPGGVTDIWNNANAAHLSAAISYGDPNNMTITSAEYGVGTGILNVTMSEDVLRYDHAKITLKDSSSSIAFGSGDLAENTAGVITITLNSTKKVSFEGLSHPRSVAIQAGGVTDIWNRTNANALTLPVSHDETTPPTLSSAKYNSSTGALTLTLSEKLVLPDNSNVILYDTSKSGNLTVSLSGASQDSPGVLTVTLAGSTKSSFEDSLSHPRHMAIPPGNIIDIWNNANAAALVSAVLPASPAPLGLDSAVYEPSSGSLKLKFSENLASYSATGIALYNPAGTANITFGSSDIAETVPGTLNATLNSQQKTTFKNWLFPRNVTVSAGAVTDIWNGTTSAKIRSTISYPGVASPAVSYAKFIADNGTLVVGFSAPLDTTTHNMASVIVRATDAPGQPSETYPLNNAMIIDNGTNYVKLDLSGNSRIYEFAASLDPLNIVFSPGAVRGIWDNQLPSVWYWQTNTTDTLPALESVTYIRGNGTLYLQFSEHMAAASLKKDNMKLNQANEGGRGYSLSNVPDSSVTVSGSLVTFTLSDHGRETVNIYFPPEINIQHGAIKDVSGNSLKAYSGYSVSTPDRNLPKLTSAHYLHQNGIISLESDGFLKSVDESKIVLHDSSGKGNVTLGDGAFPIKGNYQKVISATMEQSQITAFEDLGYPRNVTIQKGGITDIWDNSMEHTTRIISSSDNQPPGLRSAAYATATGALNLTLSEDLLSHDSAKIVLHDSTKSGNVTFAANSFTEIADGVLSINLTGSAKANFAALNHPRNATILSGGATDIWNNSNAADLMAAISDDDDTAPALSSATYAVSTGTLNLTISEDLASHDSTKITLYDSTKSGNVTFAANSFTEIADGILSINLTGSVKVNFLKLNHPRNATILSGAVTDLWNNSNAADLKSAISDDDAAAPTISSAEYTVSTGALNLTLSEDLASHDSTKVILYDSTKSGNITLAANSLAESSAGSLTMTLNATAKAGFEDLSHPRNIAILSGGVTDLWGNSNAVNLTSAISDDDDTAPTISSVEYTVSTGMLNLTLSEDLAAHDSTKITLYDSTKSGNVTFSANQFTESSAGSLTITLSGTPKSNFESLNHPRNVTVLVGGVTDLWGNSNAANLTSAISDDDAAAPTISSAEYEISTNVLNLTLSEDLAAHDSTKVVLYDSTKSGNITLAANSLTESSAGSLTMTLNSSAKASFAALNHPRNVTVLVGGVTDLWGNSNAAPLMKVISHADAPAPTISSVEYETAANMLNVTLSEDLAAHDSTKIILYDSTKSGNVTFSANAFTESSAGSLTITLSGSTKTGFEDLNHPRNITILSGGVTNIWGNSNAANLTYAISDDDDTAPTISSVEYEISSGALNLTLSEDLAVHDSTKIVLYDSTKSGNVTFSANAFTEIADGILGITLTGNTRTNFEALNHPRSVAVLSGAVTDLWGNSNAANLTYAISDDDDTAPTISSVEYEISSGALNLTLSEDLAVHDSTKITLYDATKSGNVTFSANAFTEIADGILGITLTGNTRTNFEALNHPRSVAVLSGAVTDLWGNSNAANLTYAISDDDDTAPTISSAKYEISSGALNLTLSEDLAVHDSTKIVLYDATKSGNVTFSANAFAESSAGSLTITLSGTPKSNFEALNHPRNVAILVGGVTDIWGNSNAANLTRMFSYADAPVPTISSVEYKTATGALNLTLSEDLAAHDSTKITLYDSTKSGNVTFSANAFAESSAGSLTITLSGTPKSNFEALNHPRNVAILVGGVTNIWGNSNAANLTSAISDDDSTAPTISSAKYATATGALNLTLSEDLAAHDSTKITLYDSTKSGNVTFSANSFAESSAGSLTITLSGTPKSNFEALNHPRSVAVLSGAVTDLWGNSNAANLTSAISDDDSTAPTISSAKYATATGVLNVTLSEDLAAHDSTKIILYDSTKSGNVTFSANSFAESSAGSLTITLSGTPKSNFEALNHPRSVAVLSGAVTDLWGNSNAANLTYAISDDDSTAPTISSAKYATATGVLNVTLSEDLAAHDSTKIILYDSTKSGNVTFSANSFAESSTGSLTITLSNAAKADFESLNHPRSVAVLVGGVTDLWGNSNAANLTRAFSYTDAPTPTISSAEYTISTGVLNVTISEDLAAHDSTKIILYDSTKSGNVTFSANAFAESSAGSLTITLSNTVKADFESLNHPRNAAILAGGVTNTWGNSNAANLTSAISDDDDTPPTISSAKYETATGVLNVTLSEDLAAHDSTKIILYDSTKSGNVTFSANAFAESSAGSLTITLSGTPKSNFEALNHPRNAAILAGGVTDIWGNSNAANLTSAISDDDDTPPTISSAKYATATGVLNVTLSEDLAAHDSTKIILYDSTKSGNVTFSANSFAESSTGSLTITLSNAAKADFESLNHPRNIAVLVGGVTDIWGNSNAANLTSAISDDDDTPPTISSAKYATATGVLNVTLSEDLAAHDSTKIILYDSTKSGNVTFSANSFAESPAGSLTITLSNAAKADFESLNHPRNIAVLVGGVTDIWGNSNAANLTRMFSYADAPVPTISSVEYKTATGALNLTLSEDLAAHDSTKIILYDSTKSGNVTFSANAFAESSAGSLTITLSGTPKSNFEALNHPRNVAILVGGVTNIWGNSNAANLTSAISDDDDTPPTISSAKYATATGVLNVTLSEDLAAHDSTKITLYDSTKSGNVTFSANSFAESSAGSLTITLSGTPKSNFEALNHPRSVAVLSGAVTDLWGNSNAANLTYAISDDDSTAPTISSAKYATATGVLNVTLSEDLAAHDSTKIILYDSTKSGNVTFSANSFAESSTGSLTITLSGTPKSNFEALNHPRSVAVLSGAVTDLWGNSNAANLTYAISDDDSTAPTISSAKYATATGVLNVTLSEDLAAHDSTKIILYDSTKSGNVTFSANSFAESSTGSLTITLSNAAKADFESLNHPRSVAVLVGGVTDLWGNSNAANLTRIFSYVDAPTPTISSAKYATATGVLNVTISEDLAAHDSTKIILYDSTKSGNVTFSANAFAESSAGSLTITLSNTVKADFESLNHPRNAAILAGGVTNTWGNSNTADLKSEISDDDSTAPTISSAKYATATGVLNVTLSEDLAAHDSTKIILYDSTKSGNVTFSANSFAESSAGSLTITLSNTAKANFESLNHPRNIAVLVGGVTDIWGNSNAANLTSAISDDDDAAPTISSVAYAITTDVLALVLSEDIANHDSTKITLYDSTKSGNVTFSVNAFAESSAGILSITLSGDKKTGFEALNHPRNVAILTGGVTDIWGNSNTANLTSAISDDDDTPPAISSAEYATATGILNVTLSEDLASHDSTKITLYDSTKSGNVTFAANQFTEVADGILGITLTGNTKSSFEALNHPRNVTILAGGVTDIWNNPNAAPLTAEFSYDDAAAPTISSVEYETATGILNVTLSEDLAAHDSTKITLYDSTKSGNVTFSANQFAESSTGSLTITLSNTAKADFEALNHPRNVAVLAGGVTDLWGNSNAANLTSAISDDDDTAPAISTVAYAVASGALNLTLSEDLAAHDSTKIILYDSTKSGNVTFSANQFAESSTGSLTITLSNTAKADFEALNHPRNVAVLAGGVTDLWGNSNAANLTSAISDDDDTAPSISSAGYVVTSGLLNVALSEDLAAHDSTKIILYDSTKSGNVTFTANSFAEPSPGILSITLSGNTKTNFEALNHPRNVAILVGGVTDLWGNANAANLTSAISGDDDTPPAISSAEYAVSAGILNVTISEDVAEYDSTKVVLYDSTKSGNVTLAANSLTEVSSGVLTATLNDSAKAQFESLNHPRNVTILAGGVTDIWNNPNAAPLTAEFSYDDAAAPTISSAKYATATGILNLTLSEDLAAHDSTKIILYDSTKSGNVTFAANQFAESSTGSLTITLSNAAKANFESLNHPRNVAVLAGGVTDLWGNSNAANLTSAISDDDDTAPAISTVAYAVASGALNLTLSEDLAAHDSTKITLYDSTKSGNVTFSANQFAESSTGSLTITLSNTAKANFESLNHPRNVVVLAGGVTDLWGNSNAANLTSAISDDDNAAPTISFATYVNTTGALNLTLSEDLAAHDSTKITLYDSTKSGNVTFTANQFAEADDGILSITLSGSAKTNFEALNHPRNVAVLAGGVTDIWGNSNAAELTSTISGDDSTPPTISSAEYAVASGALTITLSEDLAGHDSAKIILYDPTKSDNVTFAANQFTESSRGVLTATLSGSAKAGFEDLNHPRNVAVLSGGVTDIWGNSNTANLTSAISYDDTAPPTISSSRYAVASGALNVTLSEDLAGHDSTKMVLYDSTKSGNVTFAANQFTTADDRTLSVTLGGNARTQFMALDHPRNIAILSGGVTDIWGNSNTASTESAISYDDAAPPAMSSATYDETSGLFRLTFTEDLASHDSTKIILYDQTKSGNVTFSANAFTNSSTGSLTITLSNTTKANFEALNHPRNVAVLAGGVTDLWGNSNASPLTSAISGDTDPPRLTAATYYTGNSTILLEFDERLGRHDSTKILLSGSGATNVTFAAGRFNGSGHTIAATLTGDESRTFDGMNNPNAEVLPGGATDSWDNANTISLTARVTILDTTPPTFHSATYKTSGSITVKFSEALKSVAAGGFSISTGTHNASFPKPTLSGDTVTATLDAADAYLFDAPGVTLRIAAGAVTDRAGNPAAVHSTTNVTVVDDAPPVFVSGTYHTNGTLALSFNEVITSVDQRKIIIQHGSNEKQLSRVTNIPGSTVSFILDQSDGRALFDDAPYVVLNMGGGAITDSDGNSNVVTTGRHLAVHDNAAPYVTGATYYAATGILSLKMNEPVASAQPSMMTMNDTGSPVTLSGGADIAGDALSVALSEQNRTRFASSPSLSISMSEGAITDQAGNDILEVSYYDVAVPSPTMTLVGGAYSNDDGIVSMVFSENVTGISLEQITMQAGSNQYSLTGGSISGTQTFGSTSAGPASLPASNGRAANSPAYGNTVEVTIGGADREKLKHEDDITISISGNAVNGTTGGIGGVSAPLFVSDSVKPSFVSAAYQPDDGVLAMKFSEIVGSADPGGLTLKAGGITVNPSYLPAKLGDTVRVQMSGADKASLADASSITLDMAAGAVKDVSGNPIDAASGLKVDISRDADPAPAPAPLPPIVPPPALFLPPPLPPPPPSAPPTLAVTFDAAPAPISASYDVAYKLLAVTFTEAITYEGAETGGFNLTSSGAPLELERPAQSGPRTITALVKGAPEPHNMTLRLYADAVKDGSGNGNRPSEVAVRVHDSARPAPSHAAYNLTSGHIVVHFDNEITDVDPALFRIGNGSLLDIVRGETLLERAAYFAIDEKHRDDVESYRTLDAEAGAATGPDGASSPPAYGMRMYGAPVADDVGSVVYDAASDTLWLDIEGYGVAVDGSAVTLDGVSLSEMRVMLNGVPVYGGNATVFSVGELYMNVSENAITTRYGAIPAGGYPVDVFERVSVRGVSEAAAGNSTMVQIVRHPSSGAVHAALAYSHNVSLVDITDPAEPAVRGVISADGPVLDMDSVELPGAAYLAVLTNKSVTLYDAAAPAVAGRLSHAFNVSQGTISHVTLDGLGHLVVVSRDTATSILVAEPSSPTVLSRASLGGAAAARIDSVGVANGVAAASMLSGELCLLDVNATSGLAAECVEYGGGDHAALAYVTAQEGPRIVSAGNASAISVHDVYLNTTATRGTDEAASDVGAALIYGKAYAVALVSGEVVVYDAAGGLARVASAFTPHTALDVAEFAGSVYAVLAGQNVTVVELAGTARHADP